ncbi:MAG: hypothetical protein ABGY41_03670, partial [Candidatus Poribacteria bacterium]
YAWSDDPRTTADAFDLVTGCYELTVTDANACIIVKDTCIAEVAPLVAVADITNNTCFGTDNGTFTVTLTGGSQLPGGGSRDCTTTIAAGRFL